MNRSRPRTYQFSQPFLSISQVQEFLKLDNSSIQDAPNYQSQLQQSSTENNENSINNNSSVASQYQSESTANNKQGSNNNENIINPSVSNPSNNAVAGPSIFTSFSGPGQSSQYQKVAFGTNNGSNSLFQDKGGNVENIEKKRRLQGYSYLRLRQDQNLPKPDAYELRTDDIKFLNQFNKTFSQNMRKENPNKYEELIAQQNLRQEENGEGANNSVGDENNCKLQSSDNDGIIFIINEDMLEKLFIHFEKKSTRDTTATFQEVKLELPREYEEHLNSKELDELYSYWKGEREREYERQGEKITEKQKELYPFMRKYWRATTEDISAHAAFRPREAIRMRTRKSARPENKETYEKMLSLESDFKKYRLIALNLKKRELIKREIAYSTITEFIQSIPGLNSELQIFNKFVSRAQEIKNISNLIQPKSGKPSKPSKPKAPKQEQNKEIPQPILPKEIKDDEIMNADEPLPEVTKKIKINVSKLENDKKNKNNFSDETKKVLVNGELDEGEENVDKTFEDNQQASETKKKKKSQKKKLNQVQPNEEEAQGDSQVPIPGEVQPPSKKQKKKKSQEVKNQASSNIITLPLLQPDDSQASYNPLALSANEDNIMQDEEGQQYAAPGQMEINNKKKKIKKEKKEKIEKLENTENIEKTEKSKDSKDVKQRKKKKKNEEQMLNDDESIKQDEAGYGHFVLSPQEKLDSQSILPPDNDYSRVEKQDESQQIFNPPTKKKVQNRQRKPKNLEQTVHDDNATGGVPELDNEKDIRERVSSIQVSSAQIIQHESSIKNFPLIKLDKEQETAQFLSSFLIYFHQLKLPITVENVDNSEKIISKNTEMQEEKKQKLKNPNTLAYLVRKRIGRSNREYLDRTFDSLIDIIGIQSGKISYLLTPRNEIIYNTFNYVNYDAVKTLSSCPQYNSNNPYSSSQNPSLSANSSILTTSTAATGSCYEDDSFNNIYQSNRRDSKNAIDKKFKVMPGNLGNDKLIQEVREKQRQLFKSSLFQSKQQKIKQVIQSPYFTELERRKRRLPSYFHNPRGQQLWIEDDDSNPLESDDVFMKSVSSLKSTIEEKQKEKEKKLKQQQKLQQEQLKKQKEAELREETARIQSLKEEQNKLSQQSQNEQLQQQKQQQLNYQQNNQLPFNKYNTSDNNTFNNNFNNNNNINYFPQESYNQDTTYQQFNQPPLNHNQSGLNYYGYDRNGSYDQGPGNMYGQNGINNNINGKVGHQQSMDMNMMNDDIYSPMQYPQRNHQNSFQGPDFGPQLQGVQSQQNNIQMNQQQSYQDGGYPPYYDNDENLNEFENNFGNQNNYDNNFYQYQNNEYVQNENELENNDNYLDDNNNNNNYMDDDL